MQQVQRQRSAWPSSNLYAALSRFSNSSLSKDDKISGCQLSFIGLAIVEFLLKVFFAVCRRCKSNIPWFPSHVEAVQVFGRRLAANFLLVKGERLCCLLAPTSSCDALCTMLDCVGQCGIRISTKIFSALGSDP